MKSLVQELEARLADLRAQGLNRELRENDSPPGPQICLHGKALLNFSSNDYLGLANEPALKEAAIRAVERFGAGAAASRLLCGSLTPHRELEEALAEFKGAEAVLSFSTGYAGALGVICALLGKNDIIVLDKLVHACIVDAARLCGASLRVFSHNNLNELEDILKWADGRVRNSQSIGHSSPSTGREPHSTGGQRPRVLIVTESVFSMDGDSAPLRELVELKEKYGAWLMVDEAHATGLYGPNRRGLAEAMGVSDRIEVQMGTLGKALGAAGGFIAGPRSLVDYLINRARPFIFSTAPVPAAAAAATAGVRFVQSAAGAERARSLWERVSEFQSGLKAGLSGPGRSSAFPSAIIPVVIGDEAKAVEAAATLQEKGVFIPAIRYPTVARGAARLRVTLTASHTSEQIQKLLSALKATGAAQSPRICS
jgi:7-keto-8-aminopelargonate synthetase-like enzyme